MNNQYVFNPVGATSSMTKEQYEALSKKCSSRRGACTDDEFYSMLDYEHERDSKFFLKSLKYTAYGLATVWALSYTGLFKAKRKKEKQ